ncbi:MAG: hypothetical protein ACXWC7_09490 [Chitinophagaceae bacterium]
MAIAKNRLTDTMLHCRKIPQVKSTTTIRLTTTARKTIQLKKDFKKKIA